MGTRHLITVDATEHPAYGPFVRRIVPRVLACDYKRPGDWVIKLCADEKNVVTGRVYLQVGHLRPDMITGEEGWGYGGKAYLSEHMTDSEVVQTIFGLFKAYEEHETREGFHYADKRVFGPHLDIFQVWEIAHLTDARPPL